MLRRIYANENVCIGCRLCEVYCAVQHSPSQDILKAYRQEHRPVPAIKVQEEGALSFALQCRHCEEPACLAACLTGAMQRDARGVVVVDAMRCIGCWSCLLACPYGAVVRDEARRHSVKCDLCAGAAAPVCVAMCPNGALTWAEQPPTSLWADSPADAQPIAAPTAPSDAPLKERAS